MKIEEVIEILERKTTIPGDGCTWEQIEEAIDAAVTALRSMLEAGESLSLEQLKQMYGKPVWIERVEAPYDGKWFIVNYADTENPDKTLYTDSGVTYSEYGKYFIAYPYPPAHIDRETWTAKWIEDGDCEHKPHRIRDVKKWRKYKCSKCGYKAGRSNSRNYCPSCGRAMTPEAWAELERRLRG